MLKKKLQAVINSINTGVNLVNPVFAYLIIHSLQNLRPETIDFSLEKTKQCLDRAVAWALFQQQIQKDGGITSRVSFKNARTVVEGSYPEVTGYLIPSLFDYAALFSDQKVRQAAILAADFELKEQLKNGAFPGGAVGKLTGPSVFNSAQIIHGLVRTYLETKNKKYLTAALRAGDWIKKVQDHDGSWTKFNYLKMKRVYDTKVSQALLELGNAAKTKKYLPAVNKNLDFVLKNQKENGWFYNADNTFQNNHQPLTHTLFYTVQGLLECSKLLKRPELYRAGKYTADAVLQKFELSKKIPAGRYDSNWRGTVESSCLTGDGQISLCWLDLYKKTADLRYLNAALKLNDFLKAIQYHSRFRAIDGAIPSSYPIWGDYNPYSINSWGVKYFIDALIWEYKIKKELG